MNVPRVNNSGVQKANAVKGAGDVAPTPIGSPGMAADQWYKPSTSAEPGQAPYLNPTAKKWAFAQGGAALIGAVGAGYMVAVIGTAAEMGDIAAVFGPVSAVAGPVLVAWLLLWGVGMLCRTGILGTKAARTGESMCAFVSYPFKLIGKAIWPKV